MRMDEIPPGLIEALMALGEDAGAGDGTMIYCIRPDPRDRLMQAFEEGLAEGHRFSDIFGGALKSADEIIGALKSDGRVHVMQTVELDPALAPYL